MENMLMFINSREDFLVQFVLNRAAACDGNTGAETWYKAAVTAWELIQQDTLANPNENEVEYGEVTD